MLWPTTQSWSPRTDTDRCRKHRGLPGVADRISYTNINTEAYHVVAAVRDIIPGNQ